MKTFTYIIRYKDMDLWLANNGPTKWTNDKHNFLVFRATSAEIAHDYVANTMQQYHKEPLVMEEWPAK